MKKLFPVMALVLLVFGCSKEKIYKENLEGTWVVYKYLYNNGDKTSMFHGMFPDYNITFTSSGFTEEYKPIPTDSITTVGTYSFIDNDEKILLEHNVLTTTYIKDSSNAVIDSTLTTHKVKREYTIFNLTKDHVQLRSDTSQLYMRKPEVK